MTSKAYRQFQEIAEAEARVRGQYAPVVQRLERERDKLLYALEHICTVCACGGGECAGNCDDAVKERAINSVRKSMSGR